MSDESAERLLIIRSRVIERQHFSEYNLTSVQHILIDWFPRAIFRDLTSDTVSVDVAAGETVALPVFEPGNYPFHCHIHPDMMGELVVS